jgi:endonuclease YncB( thermonuclease family)
MPFTLIAGRFKPLAGIPDGDSVRFLADNLSLWGKLEGKPVNLGTGVETKNTVQLRFEGIDAIEKGALQPLATQARENMFKLIGFESNSAPQPRGYILARMTDDQSRRPIAFAFVGSSKLRDGSDVFLDAALLRRSVNYRQMNDGFAYPLYYNTLFATLRQELNNALRQARQKRRGYWPTDRTTKGVAPTRREDLARIAPIWPKLWRRLDTFLAANSSLSGFKAFLQQENERIDVLSEMEERGLQDLVEVRGNKVRLLEAPENLRVVGAAGQRKR